MILSNILPKIYILGYICPIIGSKKGSKHGLNMVRININQTTIENYLGLKDNMEKKLSEVESKTRVSYPQDWSAYNQAQTQEKILFLEFLHDLTSQIPKQKRNGRGRPPINIGDMIFCCCLKIYLDFSSRRSEGDIQLAYELGYIDRIPHFNSILNYLNNPVLKSYLTQLIQLSALPLKDFEKIFTVDATGFSTSMFGRWLNLRACSKMEVVNIRKYMKCHIMSGTRTNIITHVEVTDHTVHDTLKFPDLVNNTGQNFDMQEVCADMGYMSRKNYSIVAHHGGVPYIPFKENTISRAMGVPIWRTMHHFFKEHHDEFMKHYHQRSNAESVFSAIKRKFGDYLRTKNPTACTNEILCKCLVHNLCCLIQEMFTLGIKIDFQNNAARIFCAKTGW